MAPPADRARLEAQQAELLRALIRGDGFPQDFDDSIRVELLLARASIAGPPEMPRRRRGALLGAVLLREPRRLLIVHRTPRRGRRVVAVPLSRRR